MYKKLNFYNGMKTTVTLPNTRPCCVDIHIYKMKSVTRKRCSLRYT